MSGSFDPGGQPPFGQPYEPPTVPGNAPGWGSGQMPPYGGAPQGPYPPAPWGPGSPTVPGSGYAPPAAPPAKRRSLRWLWITLGIVVALLVACGGVGAFALAQFAAPATEAGLFCGHMKAANYGAAYADLSASMRAQVTADEFAKGAQFITVAEGTITRCAQAPGGKAYTYSFGAKTATLNAVMTRSIAGELVGNIGLVQEHGAWKVGSLDTSLLGINLGALKAAGAFCAALQSQNYTAAYALLSSSEQSQAPAVAFTTVLGLNDTIDGKVTNCALTGFTVSSSDTSATLNVSFTRATLGALHGTVTLKVEGGAWKIDNVADSLQGTDIEPLLVGEQFCADLVANKYADAFALLTQRLATKIGGVDAFTADFTEPQPYAWAGCTPDLKSYKVSGSDAQFNGTLNETNTDTKTNLSHPYAFYFVKESGGWKFDGFGKPNT